MKVYSYYHMKSGALHTRVFKCDESTPYADKDAAANAPEDHAFIRGAYDARSKRVNLERVSEELLAHAKAHAGVEHPPAFSPSQAVLEEMPP